MGVVPAILNRVVVRDPDPETLQLIRDFLEPLGYLVESPEQHNGAAAAVLPGIAGAQSTPDEND